jgi:acetyl-CoA C-acetyltransferase
MDYDYEGMYGLTTTAQAALLMQRYLYEYGLARNALAVFPILAHANAVNNPNAMFRRAISLEMYENAAMISDPLNMFDQAPLADGAAAVMLTRRELLANPQHLPLVRVVGSSSVVDTLAPHDRSDLLAFEAAGLSVQRACRQAGILPGDADFFELFDSFSIYAALTLEAAGFADRGEGWKLAGSGRLALSGDLPICTLGGAKGRGNPIGASGVYQIVEAVLQLRGQAGKSQVSSAQRALVQSLGGPASTAVTHVLERVET